MVPRASDVIKTLSSPLNGQGPAIDAWIAANTPFDDIVPLYSKYMSPYINSVAASIQVVQSIGQNSSGLSGVASLGNTLGKDAATAASKAAEAAAGGGALALGRPRPVLRATSAVWRRVWVRRFRSGGCRRRRAGRRGMPRSIRGWPPRFRPAPQGANSFPMAPPFGQFVNGGYGRNQPTYGFKPSVMAKPPAAG